MVVTSYYMLQFVSELMVSDTLTQFEQLKMKRDLFTCYFFWLLVKAAQIRKQLLTIPQQVMSWELLNIISKPPALDPLGFGMSHGGERGGVESTHFSVDMTKLCYSLMFVRHDTNAMALEGSLDGLRYP